VSRPVFCISGPPLTFISVIAGLDPAIHLHPKKMDPRVKPAGDDGRVWIAAEYLPMDAIDRKILHELQQDASLSVAEIGNRVGLSSTPCWKRIQKLEADGVIEKRVALVDQDKVGLGVTVFVSIETADHSEAWLKAFAERVGAMPEVMEFYRMAGDVDYMLRVVVPDIHGYDRFYKQLIATIPLKNVTSRFAMEKIKSTTALPLP
jgi:Lrp/AsnC family transcriptional regulator